MTIQTGPEFIDVTAPPDIEIEVQHRPQFQKETRVLYIHVGGRSVFRACRIPDSANLTIRDREQKPFLVRFWHGTPKKESAFYKGLLTLVRQSEHDNNLWFDGDLMTWAKSFGQHFLYFPPKENEKEHISGTIWVTQHRHFGGIG